jgi:hypothetical protein
VAAVVLAACSSGVGPSDSPERQASRWLDESGAGDGAILVLNQVQVDRLGMTHVRFDQQLDGVPVFGAQGIVHLDRDGAVRFFSRPPTCGTGR